MDRLLLGVQWREACYVNGMLPFSSKKFCSGGRRLGVSPLLDHYLDNFITGVSAVQLEPGMDPGDLQGARSAILAAAPPTV